MYSYDPVSVCCKKINFDIVDEKISNVQFIGGCNGNLKGIASLLQGLKVEDAIEKLKGITCGSRNTSCPDQFAAALEKLILKK